jgi:ApaG protein
MVRSPESIVMSETVTEGIRVQVKPSFWVERSSAENQQWAFTYTVVITNQSDRPATLMRRHWIITDGTGHVEEVRGDGVVGKRPKIGPGESFEYTSWVLLRTPFGTMRGEFFMERPRAIRFDVKIGEFALVQPNALN